jgi:hypothetical protein
LRKETERGREFRRTRYRENSLEGKIRESKSVGE